MKKNPLVVLGFQSLVFAMKGRAATRAEQHALERAAEALDATGLAPEELLLRQAALDCARADPLTNDLVRRLDEALGQLPHFSHRWQRRRDLA